MLAAMRMPRAASNASPFGFTPTRLEGVPLGTGANTETVSRPDWR